LLAGIGTVPI
nr:Chain P, 10-meric peptide from Solute carrier organic anion transporter family member 2A1 [Homo sapiens]